MKYSRGEDRFKLPGKRPDAGRRRTATRVSGYKSHPDATGGEYEALEVPSFELAAEEAITISLSYDSPAPEAWVGFGGWYCAPDTVVVTLDGTGIPRRRTLTPPKAPNWSKFGAMWVSDGSPFSAKLSLQATSPAAVSVWRLGCGMIQHRHLEEARTGLLANMYKFSPEAHFLAEEGSVRFECEDVYDHASETQVLHTKACNRCARFLPINIDNERVALSFSNHCVAEHRRPCSHTGFGTLKDIHSGVGIELEYGFQLECRFCKKFEVNAAHNPQRTAAQMKEDSARRRAFELLLLELLDGSPQLRYRHETGKELAEVVFDRFDGKCFKCGTSFSSRKEMHLDHTRPLALLWPLDETATALCGDCNSAKRDRPPVDYYTPAQLDRLAELTGLSREELDDPTPNVDAVVILLDRLEWFATNFLQRPDVAKAIAGGKDTSKLIVRALQKVINRCPRECRVSLQARVDEILR